MCKIKFISIITTMITMIKVNVMSVTQDHKSAIKCLFKEKKLVTILEFNKLN